MSIRFRRGRRRRSDAFAERFAPSPLDQSPSEVPPAMWLPPLRPVLPEGAPVGISIGEFKPQRELENAFWPGPPSAVLENWGEWDRDHQARTPWRWPVRRAALGLASVAAVAAGAALPLMM